ncbi:membrane dipeptidase [Porphyromonas circumdentaria]|uniref:Zn-dependent dipeptidase, dipeptidase homolog n=1 Tax=Porphyromonas circumdentaria TaxID=29524 RepID=A0A1T4KLX6_9PORP|nr:membrane dipeptidase [Porphyromonas circumdentaria]MDO4722195.1 membrane dipeptidase [Porphyromonas circumdentaria]SJZ43373.1 Zn-dependent dipeptidase, dipeptidase homolog [Porphyromonas circumdentaria]
MLDAPNIEQLPLALRRLYEEAEGRNVSPLSLQAVPRIGLTCHTTEAGYSVNPAYVQVIEEAGGIPILLPTLRESCKHTALLETLDGLLLTGGGDVHPSFLGEEPVPELGKIDYPRDRYELELILFAYRRNIPMLGICRGFQMINIALGGTLMQDLYKSFPLPPSFYKRLSSPINHSPEMDKREGAHTVTFTTGHSMLAEIMGHTGGDAIWVNSLHHQAIGKLSKELRLEAVAPDGIIEAAVGYPNKPIVGVQWHPEHMACGGNPEMKSLFTFFVREASLFAQAKAIHRKSIVLDSHTDTPMFLTPESDLTQRGEWKVDAVKMEEGKVDATIMVAYLPQGKRSSEDLLKAQDFALNKLKVIEYVVSQNKDRLLYASSVEEIKRAKREGLLSIVPAIENGYALGKSLTLLEEYRRMGVVYITLCHNGDNDICDSACRSVREHKGLSNFGKEVVLKMNELGILIDVSHASDDTIADVLELSQRPIIASHSSCRALCPHPRNLTDEQIRRIAQLGGVVQICLYSDFISEKPGLACVQEAANHIDHIVSLAGYEAVGIGSDFDGGGDLEGCHGSNDLINLTVELLRRGYSEEQLIAILGGNFLRVMAMSGR